MNGSKRFSEAELAAEYWRTCWDVLASPSYEDELRAERELFERFANHPHYDEASA